MPIGGALGMVPGRLDRASITAGTRRSSSSARRAARGASRRCLLPEPVRGASEGVDPERLQEHEQAGASREDYLDLMVNSSYTYSVFGMAVLHVRHRRPGVLAAHVPDGRHKGIEQVEATRSWA